MRLVGTLSWRASAAALMFNARRSSVSTSPGWIGMRAMSSLLSMVVKDFYFVGSWGRIVRLEANPPLVVDANAVLPFPVALQGLQTVARPGQVSEGGCGFKLRKLVRSGAFNPEKRL